MSQSFKQIYIGTHHKTGTVLMQDIFSEIANLHRLQFLNLVTDNSTAIHSADIIFDWHSTLRQELQLLPNVKGIHVIRDPRMIVISAVRYHLKSTEPWLHTALPEFGGRTYQQALNALSSDRERLIFEMHGHHFAESAGQTIMSMVKWVNANHSWCLNVRLEALMTDFELNLYRDIFQHLRLDPPILSDALRIAYKNSVFNPDFKSGHTRTRSPENWRDSFDDELAGTFQRMFPGVVELLGYSW